MTPAAYVGVTPIEEDGVIFEDRMSDIHERLLSLQEESNVLMSSISQKLKEMGL